MQIKLKKIIKLVIFKLKKKYFLAAIYILIFISCTTTLEPNNFSNVISETSITLNQTDQKYISLENKNIYSSLYYFDDYSCAPYLGSRVNPKCLFGVEYEVTLDLEEPIVNLIYFNEFFFIATKKGIVYQADKNFSKIEAILNIDNFVDPNADRGFKSIAFSKDEETFLVSYVSNERMLVYDLYKYNKSYSNNTFVKTVLEIYNPFEDISWHYGGHIIWSENLKTYVSGVGDFFPNSAESRLNTLPLETNNYFGKLITLNNETDFNNFKYKIFVESQSEVSNIISVGLRNPWQFFEYGNYFIIPDVGLSINEELNIIRIENLNGSFGWPIYEGSLESQLIDDIKNYNLNLTVVDKEENISYNQNKIKEISIKPNFYYNHTPSGDHYRGAIIGGDIFNGENDYYGNSIVFADHISGEIFIYNFENNTLSISELKIPKRITALKIYNQKEGVLIASTMDGEIIKIKLP